MTRPAGRCRGRRAADGRRRRGARAGARRRARRRCRRRGCCRPCTSGCGRAAASSWRSCAPPIPYSSASAASTTTTTTHAIEKLDEFVTRGAAHPRPRTAATCCSSRSATRARTCTRSSGRRSRTRTTPRARQRPRSSCGSWRAQPPPTGIQIGIAYGRLRSGTYGHELRRTFVCLGRRGQPRRAADVARARGRDLRRGRRARAAAGDAFDWQRARPGSR